VTAYQFQKSVEDGVKSAELDSDDERDATAGFAAVVYGAKVLLDPLHREIAAGNSTLGESAATLLGGTIYDGQESAREFGLTIASLPLKERPEHLELAREATSWVITTE
jgi:hypothetical protein